MPDLRTRLAAAVAPRYVVDRELATGGMGIVFLGRDPVLGREVAIKVLPPERATAIAVERFLREARLLARLTHPHIVSILEAQRSNDLLWLVMPRIEGGTLADRLTTGPLPASDVRRLGMDLLSALEHAHRHGVVHRDIKPANIFMQSSRGLLADFGVAMLDTAQDDSLTAPGQPVGTLRYMAPEQAATGEVTERTDLYALGVTLYEAATGRRWQLADSTDSGTWRALPKRLRHALRGALQADPARRWSTAEKFRIALAAGRRRGVPAVVVAGVSLVALAGIIAARRVLAVRGDANPSAGHRRAALVVLPFTGIDTIGARLAAYTSEQLENAAIPAGVLPAFRVRNMDTTAALRVADNVVVGRIKDDTLELSVFDSAHAGIFRVPRGGGDVAVWARATADSIVRRYFVRQLTDFRQVGAFPNARAEEAYRAGQELFQRGDWANAEQQFAEAEGLDSLMFRAAWSRLLARRWQRLPFEADMARLATRFPPPLDELARLELEPDLEKRIAGLDSLARAYPYYSTVREMQANELFHRGPLVGRPLREGVDSFRSLAEHFPDLDQPTTYTQTVWGLVRLGDKDLAAAQFARRKVVALPGDPWTDMLWLAVKGRFQRWLAAPARDFMLWRADSSTVATLQQAVRLGLEVDDPFDQLAIGTALARHKGTSDSLRASAFATEATALLLLGRPNAALARLDSGAALVRGNSSYRLESAEWRVLLPLLPGAAIDIGEAERARGRSALRAVPPTDSLFWPRAAWALAVDAIERGDRRDRDSLLTLLQARSATPAVADLTAVARAIALGKAGNPDSALALSRRIHRVPDESAAGVRGPLVRALVYLHRGDWQLQRGNLRGAESEWLWHENNDVQGWPSREPEEGELDAGLSAVARLLRAENLMHLDRMQEACDMLQRVETLWSNAEPPFTALRARAAAARRRCLA
ncbi:MAG: protein kinase domain-containing protein [Gemmatimonadales bacterium]